MRMSHFFNTLLEISSAKFWRNELVVPGCLSKMWKEGDELMELLSNRDPELRDLENSQPSHYAKNKKTYSKGNTKSAYEQWFNKETLSVIHIFN
jgi:hypothetical protein